jgi:acyl dehydratase
MNKGNNATVTVRSETKDRDGSLIFVNEFTNFIRGAHGTEIGGAQEPDIKVPGRAPDKIMEEKTTVQQAAYYRLNGDPNPLHIDPEMSSMAGFEKPILHGLCTFGIAAKHIVKAYGSSKSASLKSVKVFVSSIRRGFNSRDVGTIQ